MKRFIDLGSEYVEYLKVAKASKGKPCFFFTLPYLCMPVCASLLDCFFPLCLNQVL
jgi:hypothetical protein